MSSVVSAARVGFNYLDDVRSGKKARHCDADHRGNRKRHRDDDDDRESGRPRKGHGQHRTPLGAPAASGPPAPVRWLTGAASW